MFIWILILIEMLMYSCIRILHLCWNASVYKGVALGDVFSAFLMGFRVDLETVALFAGPAYLIWLFFAIQHARTKNGPFEKKPKRWHAWLVILVFLLFELPPIIVSLLDVEFINFTGRRFTYDSIFFLTETAGKWSDVLSVYGGLSALATAIVVANILLTLPVARRSQIHGRWWFLILSTLLLFVAGRGGWQKKPFGFSQAQVFQTPGLNHLALNSGFSFLQTLKRAAVPKDHFFPDSDKEWLKLLPGGHQAPTTMDGKRWWMDGASPTHEKQNVVIIIVESLSLQYMGLPFHDKGYTPFVDDLAKRGIFFQHNFANARRSIEGIGAVVASVPALMNEPFLSSPYTSIDFLRLGTFFERQGYRSSFFHGGHNGTMYFDSFMQALGVQKYFGASEYNNAKDDDGTWGIYDGPFLQRMNQELSQEKTPFISTVFTLSSHNPFHLPENAQGKFPKGDSEIHESIGYMDESLKQFFVSAAKEKWYPNTLFVITGDHTYGGSRPEFANDLGNHRIPLILFHPKWESNPELKPAVDLQEVTSQIDILPTILDFLGLQNETENFLAQSVFKQDEHYAFFYENDRYHLVAKDYFVTYQRGQEFRRFDSSDVKEVAGQVLAPDAPEVKRVKAFMQYFSDGLLQNKLYRATPSP